MCEYCNLDYSEEPLSLLQHIIQISRVHFYKPIQIAEILFRARTTPEQINLNDHEYIRTESKRWRDVISQRLVGNVSTSNSRYQDDLLIRAIPPQSLIELAECNNNHNGAIELHIYNAMIEKWSSMTQILQYIQNSSIHTFSVTHLTSLFTVEAGLRRSIDKMYEIVTHTILSFLIEHVIGGRVQINLGQVPGDFDNLTDVMFSESQTDMRLNRVGVANAADRGIDIISNFGPIIQVKHLDLTEELVIEICAGLPNSQVVIVGRNIETEVVSSIDENRPNNLLGIYSLSDINQWYETVRDSIEISNSQKEQLMDILHDSMIAEFPHLGQMGLFCTERGYDI